MYVHKIPNHLEVEDKFILFLSIRQCVIVFVAACIAYEVFNGVFQAIPAAGLALVIALVAALLIFVAGLALAIIRIHSRGLDEWLFVLLMYAVQPKQYTWHYNQPDAFERSGDRDTSSSIRKTIQKAEDGEW